MDNIPAYDGPTQLVHLHCHTKFSTLDGVAEPSQYFNLAAERGWPAVAITEHGTLASVPDNYIAAKEAKVKYIIGNEMYYNDFELERRRRVEEEGKLFKIRALKDKDPDTYYKYTRARHLTVLAKNEIGAENLITLTTLAFKDGMYYKPRTWFDMIAQYHKGLHILSGCLNGPVAHAIRNNNIDGPYGAKYYIERFKALLGDDYSMEFQMPGLQFDPDVPGSFDDWKVFAKLNELANYYKLRKTLANDSHYINRRDFDLQKTMMAIDQDTTVNSPDLFHVNSSEQYFKTREELWAMFKGNPYSKDVSDAEFHQMCDGTLEVASMCQTFSPDTKPHIPELPNDVNELKNMVAKAIIDKGLHLDKTKYTMDNRQVTYVEQAKLELDRFREKGFSSYFLITKDLVGYSLFTLKAPVGPRGSVGGSLVCYLIGLHDLDPIAWELSFDRFLSEARGGKLLNIKLE